MSWQPTRDLVGYGPNPPDPKWPGGAYVAVQFVVNYEEGGENCVLHGDRASAVSRNVGDHGLGGLTVREVIHADGVPALGCEASGCRADAAAAARDEEDWCHHGMSWQSNTEKPWALGCRTFQSLRITRCRGRRGQQHSC